jgi:hypothetical protein
MVNRALKFFGAVIIATCAASRARAAESAWTAASGVLPSAANPPYSFYEELTASVSLGAGVLKLDTSPASSRATYFQESDALSVPPNLVVEARVRFVSGTSDVPGHAPAGISFYPSKGVANSLWIGRDEVFVNAGTRFARGAVAGVDTDGAFHDYRIEVQGTSAGSRLDVFYDGAPLLTGALFLDDPDQEAEIGWGDLAYDASGVSEWQSFRHNAAIPEPSCATPLLLAGLTLVTKRSRRRCSRT